jgi:hypothetical protein
MQSIARRVLFEVFVGCSLLAALPIAGSAAEIHLCTTGCDPTLTPITLSDDTLDEVSAADAVDGTQTLEFINLTGSIMDNLVFETTINQGLSTATLSADGDFTCALDTGLFLNCEVAYDPGTGALVYDYYDVNAPNILDTPGFVILEDFLGQGFGDTGIPNLGVFEVQLTGWTADLTDPNLAAPTNPTGQLYGNPPGFSNNGYNVTNPIGSGFVALPEPSAALILLTELLLLAGVLAVFRRKLNWKQRFDL